jgi:CRISPR system Cascade subunit CasD
MSNQHNTLFLRLAGPMQSWGTSSRFQLRRTDAYPSKSGVLGLLLCAEGVPREESLQALEALAPVLMGVRVDRCGTLGWDYHTAGAKIGMRKAEGGVKNIPGTKTPETLLSRRQYLYDASFLVALQGDEGIVAHYADRLQNPAWPVFLGRKCCVPGEPVFVKTADFDTLTQALSSIPWQPRINAIDRDERGTTRIVDVYLEQPPGSAAPAEARLRYDVPRVFGFWSYSPRWIVKDQVTVPVGDETQGSLPPGRASQPDRDAMRHRLLTDHYLCVFCSAPAEEVHHWTYENYGHETDGDLRSLCRICHLACTALEYGHDMRRNRIDPLDPAQRLPILRQIERLLKEGQPGRRYELLGAARTEQVDFFDAAPNGSVE